MDYKAIKKVPIKLGDGAERFLYYTTESSGLFKGRHEGKSLFNRGWLIKISEEELVDLIWCGLVGRPETPAELLPLIEVQAVDYYSAQIVEALTGKTKAQLEAETKAAEAKAAAEKKEPEANGAVKTGTSPPGASPSPSLVSAKPTIGD